jgi:osmotically-inducible protein OsmY
MKGVVTLIGTVMRSQGRKKPTSVSKHTEGAHGVVSRLRIGQKKG